VTRRRDLTFWWWGEDEAPGLGRWLARACADFEAEHGVHVETRLLRHDEVLPGFPAAAAAGSAPDLHFFWNGIYLVDNVWKGHLAPLDELLDADELPLVGGGPLSVVDGKTYRAGWYAIPVVWFANRTVLEQAGVEALPLTWGELEAACARVSDSGFAPFAAGDGEADFSVWWLTHFLTQELRAPDELPRLVLGELDWREARFRRHWSLLAHAVERGWLDPVALPLTLWRGLDRFNSGAAAFTLGSGPMFNGTRGALGEAATVLLAPTAGAGPLAARPIVDTQGIGIWSGSRQPELAARFLSFLHDEERRRALWDEVRLFPADRRWDGGDRIGDPDYRLMWDWYAGGEGVLYGPNLLPLELHFAVAAELGQSVIAGRSTDLEAGELAAERAREWRERDAVATARYRAWATSVAAAYADAPSS
jgi:raffinose/stachyose/melibiose transport system substrate-binding protein